MPIKASGRRGRVGDIKLSASLVKSLEENNFRLSRKLVQAFGTDYVANTAAALGIPEILLDDDPVDSVTEEEDL